jgi:hypothetical protein
LNIFNPYVQKVQLVQWVQKVGEFSSADVGVFTNHQSRRRFVVAVEIEKC